MAVRSRLRDIVIDCARPSTLAAFWAAVLDYQVRPHSEDKIAEFKTAGINDVADAPSVRLDAPDGGPGIWFEQVPEPKTAKDRIHLDVTLRPGETLDWLVSLGATVLQPLGSFPDQHWTVMADPEGNEFCAFLSEA